MNVNLETDIDIDPQVETVAEQSATTRHETRREHESAPGHKYSGRGLKMWLLLSFQVIYRDYRLVCVLVHSE